MATTDRSYNRNLYSTFLPAAPGSGSRYNASYASDYFYDALKRQYVTKAGLPYTGPIGSTGNFAVNGAWSATPPAGATDPNTPPALQVSNTVKTKEIFDPTVAAISQQAKQAAKTQEELTSFKDTASDILNRTYTRTQGAADTSGTAAALNKSLDTQEAAQRGLTAEAEQRNKAYTAQTQSLLDKMDKAFADEEAKTRAVGERAMNIGLTQGQLIPLVSGGADTVTARSGAGTSRALAAVTNALLPVEQQIAANRRYSISNFERPIQSELYRNDMALVDAKSSLERQFGGDRRAVIQYLQGLAQQASQLDQQSAEFFLSQKLRLLGLPEQFMASNISNLTALQRLLASARDDVIAQPFDPSLVPGAVSYPINVPGRSYRPSGDGLSMPGVPATATTTGAGGAAPVVPTPLRWTQEQINAYYRSRQPAGYDPNYQSGGWGFVNDRYIGKDADFYNDAFYGDVVTP